MRRFHWLAVLFLTPTLAFVFTVGGCSKKDKEKPAATKDEDEDKDKGKDDSETEDTGDQAKTAVKAKGWGTLKGKVTLEGEAPKVASLKPEMEELKKKDPKQGHCLEAPKEEIMAQGWKVRSKDKAVANVVIWLKPEKDTQYIDLPAKDEWPKEWTAPVKIDQPFCAFIPHVSVAFPQYYKDGKLTETGQKLEVFNSAPISHNTRVEGSRKFNPTVNMSLTGKEPGGKPKEQTVNIKADPQVLTLKCDIHKFMTGKIWALDTPFAAVTKGDEAKDWNADQNFGTYEIKKVPTGIPLRLYVWHEEAGPIKKGEVVTLKEGDNTMNFKFSAK
jgi:hypothetical protein